MKWLCLILAVLCSIGCSRKVYVPIESVRTEKIQTERVRTDTIEKWHDRVVERIGDTVYVTDVRYIRDVRTVTDSIVVRDSVKVEVPVEVYVSTDRKTKISKWYLLPVLAMIGCVLFMKFRRKT